MSPKTYKPSCEEHLILVGCGELYSREGIRSPEADRIWLWVSYNKIPMYSIFYLLKGDDIYTHIYTHMIIHVCK